MPQSYGCLCPQRDINIEHPNHAIQDQTAFLNITGGPGIFLQERTKRNMLQLFSLTKPQKLFGNAHVGSK